MSREAVISAVFNLLKSTAPFQTASRQAVMPSEIGDQPALYFIFDGGDYPPRGRGLPPIVTVKGEVWIYDKPIETPETFGETMNGYIDALEDALRPAPGFERQTAGGAIFDVRIEGEVILDPGHTTGQAVLRMPIKILIP